MLGYAPPTVETIPVRLPGVTVRRPLKRGDGYRLELGKFVARGTTLAAARDDLARQLGLTVESVNVDPAFARDDDGTSVIVALARPWGVDEYRITEQGHKLTGCYAPDYADPAALLAKTHHYTVLPPRTSGQSAAAPRPSLFTMAQIEQVLSTAQDRAYGFRTDQGALEVFQGAVKALLINPDTQYPLPDDDSV